MAEIYVNPSAMGSLSERLGRHERNLRNQRDALNRVRASSTIKDFPESYTSKLINLSAKVEVQLVKLKKMERTLDAAKNAYCAKEGKIVSNIIGDKANSILPHISIPTGIGTIASQIAEEFGFTQKDKWSVDSVVETIISEEGRKTGEKLLGLFGIGSVNAMIITETLRTCLDPDGKVTQLYTESDRYIFTAAKRLREGDIAGGLADLGRGTIAGLGAIGYGVADVSTEIAGRVIGDRVESIGNNIGKGTIAAGYLVKGLGKIIPGKTGEVVTIIGDGIITTGEAIKETIVNIGKNIGEWWSNLL